MVAVEWEVAEEEGESADWQDDSHRERSHSGTQHHQNSLPYIASALRSENSNQF